MSTAYIQKQSPAQKKDAPTAASVLDSSSQSESLQRKADMANNAAQRAEAPRPNNTGMPDNLKSGIESLSGFSMDSVRVHYNSSKPATVQALAYTQGTDIHVAPGQEKHLPHEAWHVAQQMAGRVSPTTNINGMAVNDNAALEHEADVMGERAVAQRKNIQSDSTPQKLKTNAGTMQRVWIGIDTSMKADSYWTLNKAREKIWDEFYVQAIRKAPYLNGNGIPDPKASENDFAMSTDSIDINWGEILITEGHESAFLGGQKAEEKNAIKLQMNIEQCKNLFFGNENDSEKALKEKSDGNQTVDSVLLHELGHAYQHYLKIKNKEIKDDPFQDLKKYPLLHDCLYQICSGINLKKNRERLLLINKVSEKYYPEQTLLKNHITLFLESPKNKAIHKLIKKSLIDLMKIVGEGAENDNDSVEADNLIMNEHIYNKKEGLPIRKQYENAVMTKNLNFILSYIAKKWNNSESILQKLPQVPLPSSQKIESQGVPPPPPSPIPKKIVLSKEQINLLTRFNDILKQSEEIKDNLKFKPIQKQIGLKLSKEQLSKEQLAFVEKIIELLEIAKELQTKK